MNGTARRSLHLQVLCDDVDDVDVVKPAGHGQGTSVVAGGSHNPYEHAVDRVIQQHVAMNVRTYPIIV